MPMARKLAFERLCEGYKSVEIVQGFLLLSVWSQPAERYEEEQAWMMAGIAIRMAYDLNLHRRSQISLPPTFDEATKLQAQREMLNRERTWLYSFTCVGKHDRLADVAASTTASPSSPASRSSSARTRSSAPAWTGGSSPAACRRTAG